MTAFVLSAAFFVLGTVLFAAANRMASPGPTKKKAADRSVAAAVVFFVAVFVYWGLTALLGRPISVFFLCVLAMAVYVAGNALKVRLLGEVLLFSDAFLVGHALRFPRLYFGYVPVWAWGVLALAVVVLAAEIAQEPASASLQKFAFVVWLAGFFGAAWAMRRVCRNADVFLRVHAPSFRAQEDAARFTTLGAMLVHTVSFLTKAGSVRKCFDLDERVRNQPLMPTAALRPAVKPRHFVLIQAESFCPAGRILQRPSTTPFIDEMLEEPEAGRLLLDWRGAYTMRTEFSVLTGIKTTELQAYAFDPYQLARRIPMDSLARDFRALGYETQAWHPNDGRFFDRFAVMPHLGFSRLMDISAFTDLPKSGRYASDEALLAEAARYLAGCTRPTFLFIITLEAHGPWSGRGEQQLRQYEEHLAGLDRGVKTLVQGLEATNPGSTVALYGDHLPSLPAFAETSSDTAWFAHACAPSERRTQSPENSVDMPAHALRERLLAFHEGAAAR